MSRSLTNGMILPVTEFWCSSLSERWPSRGAWGADARLQDYRTTRLRDRKTMGQQDNKTEVLWSVVSGHMVLLGRVSLLLAPCFFFSSLPGYLRSRSEWKPGTECSSALPFPLRHG